MMQCLRVASEVSTRSQHSCKVVQAGTSTAACLPFFMALSCHGNVPVPWGRDVDDVELELGQVLEIPFALAEPCGLRLACVCDCLLRSRHFLRHQVADRLDLYIFNGEQILVASSCRVRRRR